MNIFYKFISVAVPLFLIMGCSSSVNESSPQVVQTVEQNSTESLPEIVTAPLQEVYWKVVEIKGKTFVFNEHEREPYLLFKIENLRIQGFSGCNILMGTYTFDEKEQIRFSQMASTMMACPHMEEETQFLAALQEVHTYWIDKGVLTLGTLNKTPLVVLESVLIQ